jgi:hypothetical protein
MPTASDKTTIHTFRLSIPVNLPLTRFNQISATFIATGIQHIREQTPVAEEAETEDGAVTL